jgi:D-alanyl-D-alanine carboxypeptidase
MTSTVFRNANGLPNPGQFTTAHDMAVLGIALREHFPQYYSYFSQQSFMYGSRRINGHNRLLGRIDGVDGIKTGYTRASGYNLVSSVKDDGRLVVAVVMGGKTGRARDNQMASLIHAYLPKASKRGGGDLVAKADSDTSPVAAIAKVMLPKHDAPTPDNRPAVAKQVAMAADDTTAADTSIGTSDAKAATVAAYAEASQVDPLATASVAKGAWVVQVASSPSQSQAKAILDKTTKRAPHVLADASSFTVAFDNDGTTYYRARFGGFGSQNAALKACNALKKKKIECYAVQQ